MKLERKPLLIKACPIEVTNRSSTLTLTHLSFCPIIKPAHLLDPAELLTLLFKAHTHWLNSHIDN